MKKPMKGGFRFGIGTFWSGLFVLWIIVNLARRYRTSVFNWFFVILMILIGVLLMLSGMRSKKKYKEYMEEQKRQQQQQLTEQYQQMRERQQILEKERQMQEREQQMVRQQQMEKQKQMEKQQQQQILKNVSQIFSSVATDLNSTYNQAEENKKQGDTVSSNNVKRTIVCKSCGGVNKQALKGNDCVYCDLPLT